MKKCLGIILIGLCFFLYLWGPALGQESKPPQKTPELIKAGKTLYEQNCAACHGPKGEGKGPVAAALTPHPADFAQPLKDWPNTKGDPSKIFEVISKGIPNSAMVGWSQLPEKDRWGLVYFVIEFATQKK